ncbi:MAG: TolC family protein [Candidatus Omnitrophica bacterium]|nr:TolC family protein [Candidatus Omnitrophota bacterium]
MTVNSFLWAQEAKPLSLMDAYQLALKRSEDLAIRKEAIEEAEAHFLQAFSGILPSVSYLITRKEQDSAAGTSDSDGVSSTSLRRSTPEQKFVFSQPIFSGFKEFAAMRGAGAEKRQRVYEHRRSEELLFIDVMESFYTVRQMKENVQVLGVVRQAVEERIKELRGRAKIGRSRESEIQSSLSDLKLLRADEEDARYALVLAKQLFEFYIGRPLAEDLAEDLAPVADKEAVDYLAKSHDRSDVKALEQAGILSDKNVQVARSGYWPTVSLDGNYYTERVGFQSDIEWDVLLSVDIPIFEGTQVAGKVKEAAAEREAARQNYSKSKRLAQLEIRNAYAAFHFLRRRENLLAQAATASEENYRLNALEYRRNLVNNLDVLDALRTWQNVRLRLNEARYETRKNYWKLQIAAGMIPRLRSEWQ